ncbi:DUF4442 domain-containing protein [Faecalibacter rhinopitheci]|uniref:DUF4442 domain-containing protein n=1 Tax=Faecalibacter rhinopitheci TaxID=2779678 RepID=A0A8J7FT51_9FLAO|nr:DUF4442 domain-containing protein [Faecalibacter rhinopitheci]MBF0597252.1 DUF4442 domain-containing protein [Faecalibacter rhinopitheci]MBQ0148205.1 DUF4442 domain-containing protein [Candidatus Onthonaster equi]
MNKAFFKSLMTTQLPIAWIAGVRLNQWEENKVSTKVKFGFLNQNPFKSMFWAVQGMAAEFSSGLMVNAKIQSSGEDISMLVIGMQAKFLKKAVGKIIFTCDQGEEIEAAIREAVATKQGVMLTVKSRGVDEQNDIVSEFEFTWTFKVR